VEQMYYFQTRSEEGSAGKRGYLRNIGWRFVAEAATPHNNFFIEYSIYPVPRTCNSMH
jgi:hypothetical protein